MCSYPLTEDTLKNSGHNTFGYYQSKNSDQNASGVNCIIKPILPVLKTFSFSSNDNADTFSISFRISACLQFLL